MNEINFCYWLQGFFELTGKERLTSDQVRMIKEHLQLVFEKKTTITLGGQNFIPDLIDGKYTYSDSIHEGSFSC